MKTTNVLLMGFLSLVVVAGLFAALTTFASDNQTISQREVETVAEESGEQRSSETAAPRLSIGCITDSMVTGDQRRSDRQAAGFEGSRILTPVKADECTETGYAMPMNR
jgi:hypothetical protein